MSGRGNDDLFPILFYHQSQFLEPNALIPLIFPVADPLLARACNATSFQKGIGYEIWSTCLVGFFYVSYGSVASFFYWLSFFQLNSALLWLSIGKIARYSLPSSHIVVIFSHADEPKQYRTISILHDLWLPSPID